MSPQKSQMSAAKIEEQNSITVSTKGQLFNKLEDYKSKLNNRQTFEIFYKLKHNACHKDKLISFFKMTPFVPPYESKFSDPKVNQCIRPKMSENRRLNMIRSPSKSKEKEDYIPPVIYVPH